MLEIIDDSVYFEDHYLGSLLWEAAADAWVFEDRFGCVPYSDSNRDNVVAFICDGYLA